MTMATEIVLRFTTPSGDYPGANCYDYFTDDGLERAQIARTAAEADAILRATYRGPDVDGVGLTWQIADIEWKESST